MTGKDGGVPHLTNAVVLTGLDLAARWKTTFQDIIFRIKSEELQSLIPHYVHKQNLKEWDEYDRMDKALIVNPYYHPVEHTLDEYCRRATGQEPICILKEHIWPYEDLHPELKAAAQELYDKTFPSATIWDPKTDGRAVKELYSKAPLDPENQRRDLLAYLLKREGFTHSQVANFLEPGLEKNPGTVKGWITAGEAILNRLHENKNKK
ncbi:MAG: hypothetical protein EOM12_17510 [Verrucomicrobiae bacterium]|nr:hypothetical protein [Verrucomicrobiae bacterium]